MNSLFEPDPLVLGFFFVQKFIWLWAVLVLAGLRLAVGKDLSRLAAGVAVALCLFGLAVTFAPAAGISGPLYASAARAMAQGGTWLLLLPSAWLAVSAILPISRWRWIDLVHGLCVAGFVGTWIWIS